MPSKILSLLSLLALTNSGFAGVTTYSYNPYAAYHHAYPAAAAVTTYASPAHQLVYHQATPAVYQNAPLLARSYVASPASVVAAAPAIRTVATPAVYHQAAAAAPAPIVTKSYVASAPIVKTVAAAPVPIVKEVEIESEPQYDFSYGVHDSLTGDIKSQVETRSGGNVAGSYSVVDADGYKRTVTYTADDLNGFNAVVQREPIAPVTARFATIAAPVATVQPVQQVVPVQHQLQYLPQQQQHQHQQIAVAQPVEHQPEQSAVEPLPVEYPEQQSEFVQQQQQQQQQHEQPQYPQEQHFPPYHHAEGDDSDVVDLRSTNNNNTGSSTNSNASAASKAEV